MRKKLQSRFIRTTTYIASLQQRKAPEVVGGRIGQNESAFVAIELDAVTRSEK